MSGVRRDEEREVEDSNGGLKETGGRMRTVGGVLLVWTVVWGVVGGVAGKSGESGR